jgi:xanthine dehydrogenase molybdopterin binding subunit
MNQHESGIKHLTGEAVYINDMAVDQLLHGYIVSSPYAHANILSIDYKDALKINGIHAIISYKDIPGDNQMGPVFHDEPCLAFDKAEFVGQAIVLIASDSLEIARKAAQLVQIEFEELEAIIDLETAIQKKNQLHPPRKIETGNIGEGFKASAYQLEGTLITGGQEHWYLETQSTIAIPGEEKEIKVFSSTQHPSETQAIIAEVLGIPRHEVEVEIRRMGGAFGGKETQANHYAAWAALLAFHTNRPVKIHLNRDEDQIMTGKRHPFLNSYKVGFNGEGKINALDLELNINAGSSSDLTMAILERALFHVDNAYYIPNFRVIGKSWKTNLPSNTAFRGFGGPQGMILIEEIIDRLARHLGKDPVAVRKLNFYKETYDNSTHYDQLIENNRLNLLYDQIINSSDYYKRRKSIDEFNHENEFYKKGIALSPVKFGISFTTSFLNQAGALVNIYQDGTVLVNHGGTEMGQGLHTKMIDIAALEFGIDRNKIKVTATNTSKVPNTSATAASSGTDLNGMAVKEAIRKLKKRLAKVALKEWLYREEYIKEVIFDNNEVYLSSQPEMVFSFEELIQKAYLDRTSLSATGFYRTPDIHFDRETGKGKPFHYFAFGMSVSEVMIDTLTGYMKLIRTDILHDVGKSINQAIDKGQIEGGFIQGLGWVTTEDLKYDDQGNLLNHSPDTYKIPGIADIPDDFRVEILKDVPNPTTIRQSKAVGEPPFMHAISVWLAIKDAISAVSHHKIEPELKVPATNENILLCIENIKSELK